MIRDAEKWATLWHRFGRLRGHAGERVQSKPPAVDFSRHILVAVSYGPTSGCSNEAKYIGEVRDEGDSIAVVLGGTEDTRPGPVLTCMMIIEPVDVVRLPRTELPVNFVSSRVPVPHWARWWAIPSAEELARMEPGERRTFLKALALDPSTSESKLQEMADHLTENDWEVASPRVDQGGRVLSQILTSPPPLSP